MRTLLLFFTVLQPALSLCSEGLEPVRDGQCRGYYGKLNASYDEAANLAIAKCQERQAYPVIIHSNEEQSYWTDLWKDRIILGLVCNTKTSQWEWADGSTVDYKPALYDSGLDANCKTGYVWYIVNAKGQWYYYNETIFYNFDLYCTAQLHQPNIPSDGCYNFDDDSEDGVCYQVGATAENWQDAQLNCRELGANLASIHNLNENSFVRRMAVSIGAVNGLFLGATISGKGADFGWVDGSKWDYQNFYPGFPKKNTGDCLAMDTSTSSGQWMNIECSSKLPVACIRDVKAVIDVPDPKCSTDDWEEDQLITSPGFPFSASMPCEYFLTAEEGKKIMLLEANTCCDFVIIHNDFLGGSIIANVTGSVSNTTYTSTTNFMRVSWQPNGGNNVKGLAMTFRGV